MAQGAMKKRSAGNARVLRNLKVLLAVLAVYYVVWRHFTWGVAAVWALVGFCAAVIHRASPLDDLAAVSKNPYSLWFDVVYIGAAALLVVPFSDMGFLLLAFIPVILVYTCLPKSK